MLLTWTDDVQHGLSNKICNFRFLLVIRLVGETLLLAFVLAFLLQLLPLLDREEWLNRTDELGNMSMISYKALDSLVELRYDEAMKSLTSFTQISQGLCVFYLFLVNSWKIRGLKVPIYLCYDQIQDFWWE